VIAASLVLAGASFAAHPARAGALDLEDDPPAQKPDDKPNALAPKLGDPVLPPAPMATIRPHAYTLAECLSLTDRNNPQLWAARARLAFVHAQLDEARYTPFSYWSANATTGVIPTFGGTAVYNQIPAAATNAGFADLQPFLQFGVRGTVPIYTFGKIDSIKKAAEAQVRYNEWDLERYRFQARFDVRRAYYGLMLARDAIYIADEVLGKLNKGIENVAAKLAANDTSVEEADRLRLEIYKDELLARVAEARKGELFASAALRFFTGVQTAFDIPDEPLKRSETPLGPVVRYLTAARLFRPDVNLARSGVAARRAQVDFARAQLLPNIGVGLGFNYNIAPSATLQNGYGFNGFGGYAAIGIDWGLDFLPKNARIQQAESQLEEARALERYALGGVAVEVENAYASAGEAKAREENWDRAEHRAKRWISSVQDAIDLGTRDERYIIEPLRAYVFARVNHVQALMDFNLALSELSRVTGWEPAAPLN
jgi:multidrug efflux system outer membrane protein